MFLRLIVLFVPLSIKIKSKLLIVLLLRPGIDSYTVISDTGANVRSGAGADYDKLGELKYGDTVRAYDTKTADNGNKWIKIRYNGQYGWVAMSNLEEEGA